MVELLRFQLRRGGFSVGTARDGIEGLKKARSISPDLILLDLMLPELDGFAVCESLRRDLAMGSVTIIMLTALSSQLARFNGLESGATDYITKPFNTKHLLARVQQLVSLSPPSASATL